MLLWTSKFQLIGVSMVSISRRNAHCANERTRVTCYRGGGKVESVLPGILLALWGQMNLRRASRQTAWGALLPGERWQEGLRARDLLLEREFASPWPV